MDQEKITGGVPFPVSSNHELAHVLDERIVKDMHYFEEEYQRRFKDAESTEGINPDQLWEGIAEELEPEPTRRFVWWWLLIPLLLLGVSVSLYYWNWSTSIEPATISTAKSNTEAQANTEAIRSIDESSLENKTVVQRTEQIPVTEAHTTLSVGPQSRTKQFKYSTSLVDPLSQTFTTPETAKHHNELSLSEEPINTEILTTPVHKEEAQENLMTTAAVAVVSSLPRLSFFPECNAPEQGTSTISSTNTSSTPAAKSIQLEVLAGTVQWHDRFSADGATNVEASTLNDAKRALGGYQLAVRLRKELPGNWSASTGLQLSQVYNIFDWTRNWDTLMYRDNIPGSDLIDATAERRVKHQNELRWVQLPVLLAYESGGEKWRFGVETGLGLNYLLSQSGRTLQDETTVLTFDKASQGPYKRFFLSTQASPFVGYQFNECTSIRLQGGLHHQWHGRSAVYQLRHQSVLTTLSIGARMRF